MNLDLAGKTALITGGSKGIGRAIAAALVAEGASVTLAARDKAQLELTRDALGSDRVTILSADLSSDAGRLALLESVETPDIVVNNAGAIRGGRLGDMTMDDLRSDWGLKVFGYIHICHQVMPRMAARGSGTIINIIGMAGRVNRANYISGSAANAALIAFTHALGSEAQANGVRVFGINPALTLTDRMTQLMNSRALDELGDDTRWREMADPARFPYGRPAEPAEVASLAVMLASPKVAYLNGTVIDLDGGGQWREQ